MMKKALIVVDYQNDFVKGSLGFSGAEKLDDLICDRIKEYKDAGDAIVFTFDTHEEDYLSTAEGKALPVPHCIRGTEGWNLYGETAKMLDSTMIGFEKGRFGSLELMNFMRLQKFDQIMLVGLVSNICILTNAVLLKTAMPDCEIVVDAACTASADSGLNKSALDIMSSIFIKVINR